MNTPPVSIDMLPPLNHGLNVVIISPEMIIDHDRDGKEEVILDGESLSRCQFNWEFPSPSQQQLSYLTLLE